MTDVSDYTVVTCNLLISLFKKVKKLSNVIHVRWSWLRGNGVTGGNLSEKIVIVHLENGCAKSCEWREMGRHGVCTANFHTTSNKQRGEVTLCDRPEETSCLWLCSQKTKGVRNCPAVTTLLRMTCVPSVCPHAVSLYNAGKQLGLLYNGQAFSFMCNLLNVWQVLLIYIIGILNCIFWHCIHWDLCDTGAWIKLSNYLKLMSSDFLKR